jgi:hypothetical protein
LGPRELHPAFDIVAGEQLYNGATFTMKTRPSVSIA